MPMTPEHIEEFLTQTQVAVICTVDAEGNPRSAPIWYQWEDGAAYLFTGRGTLKWRNILRHPYASLCLDRRELPYESMMIDGPVEEVDRPLYDLILGMAVRYYGEEEGRAFAENYRGEQARVVAFKIVPKRIVSAAEEDE